MTTPHQTTPAMQVRALRTPYAPASHAFAQYFGAPWAGFENHVQVWIERNTDYFAHDLWDYYDLPGGACYIAPPAARLLQVQLPRSRDRYQLSAQAAGLAACLWGTARLHAARPCAVLADFERVLLAAARDHPECAAICAVADIDQALAA